jgi:hypothetical protein
MHQFPPLSAVALTLHDFHRSGAARIVADHPDAPLRALTGLLFEAGAAAQTAGDTTSKAILVLLARICSIVLQPSNRSAPLTHMAAWSDGTTSFDPDHLQRHELNLLAQLVGQVDHVALRARLADLVWLRAKRHGHGYPLRAIDDYRSSAPDPTTWYEFGHAHWHRALQLAKELKGAASMRLAEIEDALVDRAEQAENEPGYDALHFLRPLIEERLGLQHADRVTDLLERRGRAAAAASDAFEAAGYLEAAKTWFERARQFDRAAEMQALLARTWEAHADAAGDAATRHAFYADAIRAYRAVSARYRGILGVDAALQAVRHKYDQAGGDAIGEMIVIHGPETDLTGLAEAAAERVRHADPLVALFAFCSLMRLPSKAEHMRGAGAFLNDAVLMRMMGGATLAEDGRVVARDAGSGAADGPTPEQVTARAMLDVADHAGKMAVGMIRPALDQLHLDQVFTVNDFRAIVERSNMVLQDRAAMVGKALYAGYMGDLEHAMHVLMPQFEHIVREVLKVAGALTTTHDPQNGLDMEIGLSRLTERPEMVTVFGEDLAFAIRAMMCVEPGPNLRNVVAHGLADSDLCQSPYALYTWWLILRVIVEQFRARWAMAGTPLEDQRAKDPR